MNCLQQYLRIIIFSSQRFISERRFLWATSLTYTTVFSLIPLLSVLFFVFNVFGSLTEIKTMVQPYIYKTLAPWAQEKVITILNDLVSNIDFRTIGFFSLSLLIISIFLLLFEIEYALNEIWLIKIKPSALFRAAVYWILLTIGPVLIALILFIFFTFQAYIPLKLLEIYVNAYGVALLSYVLILSAFTVIYFMMPGTRVSIGSALFGGLIAATLWKITGLAFNIYASRFFFYYPKIFGSLAAIPFFLLWIFLCWLLFLFGAELAYMHQNRAFYTSSHTTPAAQVHLREHYMLLVFLFIAREYHLRHAPVSLSSIATALKIPYHIVQELLDMLLRNQVLVEPANARNWFQPVKPFRKLMLSELLAAINSKNNTAEADTLQEHNDPLHSAARRILHTCTADAAVTSMDDVVAQLV